MKDLGHYRTYVHHKVQVAVVEKEVVDEGAVLNGGQRPGEVSGPHYEIWERLAKALLCCHSLVLFGPPITDKRSTKVKAPKRLYKSIQRV